MAGKYYDTNSVILIGRIGSDPGELRHAGEHPVCDLRLAVSDGDKTCWVDVTCWRQTAQFVADYCRKGHRVCVRGRLTMDEWNDKESGQKRSKIKVTADGVQMLTEKGEDGGRDERPAREPERRPVRDNGGGSPLKDYGLDDDAPF
jgi:single-strand DNA-binding protein